RTGKLGPVKALLARGADVDARERRGQTALMWAAAEGHAATVEALLRAGADFRTPLPSGFTPLFFAVREGRTDVVRILLKAGADESGDPAPIGSGDLGSLQLVRKLVEHGADVNARLKRGASGRGVLGRVGATPFLLAAMTADVPLMRTLVELGADPRLPN